MSYMWDEVELLPCSLFHMMDLMCMRRGVRTIIGGVKIIVPIIQPITLGQKEIKRCDWIGL